MAEKGAWLFKSQAKGSLGEGEATAGLSHSYQSLPDLGELVQKYLPFQEEMGKGTLGP